MGAGEIVTGKTNWPVLALLGWLLLLAGCSSLPQQTERTPSHALTNTVDTRIGRAIAPVVAQHPERSGFHALSIGLDALVARIGMVRAAERSLDLQYYIWHDDTSGRALLYEVLAAADRGVRVRLLLDDLDTAGKDKGCLLYTSPSPRDS